MTSYETTPPVRLETSGGVLSTVDMVVQRRDGPRRLRDNDDDDDEMIAMVVRGQVPGRTGEGSNAQSRARRSAVILTVTFARWPEFFIFLLVRRYCLRC